MSEADEQQGHVAGPPEPEAAEAAVAVDGAESAAEAPAEAEPASDTPEPAAEPPAAPEAF